MDKSWITHMVKVHKKSYGWKHDSVK